MLIGVVREIREFEARVAITPDTVKRYCADGFKIIIETNAGLGANITDNDFKDAGATIVKTAKDVLSKADLLLKVWRPLAKGDQGKADELKNLKKGATVISLMAPHNADKQISHFQTNKNMAFALESVPRITRAQSMDVLSSQSNLAGYRSIIEASTYFGRAFPMMMTAAGTVAPAKILIMGAGVAGLQAIATARRLGGVVSATDVRMAAKEQVESLGASFVMVEDDEVKDAETAGGYAKEMSASYKKKQAALIAETIPKQDIVITTALIPGRPAPVLITKEMVKKMRAGSVIVDLAVEQGGNCEMAKPGQVYTTDNGVTIVGHLNLPARLAADASSLYARNVYNFVSLLWDKDAKKLNINFEDEIIKASCLVFDEKLKAKKAPPKKTAVKKATVKKAVAKKTATKKTVTKKKAVKKTVAKKETAKKAVKKIEKKTAKKTKKS